MQIMKKLIAASSLALASVGAHAALAQVFMTGFDFTYNEVTGNLCDSAGCTSEAADALNRMDFTLGGSLLGSLTTNINLAVVLSLPAGTAAAGPTALVPNGDIFDARINGGPGLFTDVISGSVFFFNSGASFRASGLGDSSIFAQSLPFGLVAGDPISWAFSASAGSCTNGAVGTRTCTYSGTADLSWEQTVPEPGTLALVGAALFGAGALSRRKRAA